VTLLGIEVIDKKRRWLNWLLPRLLEQIAVASRTRSFECGGALNPPHQVGTAVEGRYQRSGKAPYGRSLLNEVNKSCTV
jgi:hypothetical protein